MVELLCGFPLFIQQYKALMKKNTILTLRNKRIIILQIFSSFFFFLLFFIGSKMEFGPNLAFDNIIDPDVPVPSAIPPCEDKFFVLKPCYDFVWSGNDNPRITNIVTAIMRNNPGRPISDNRVKSFRTPEEVDEWLMRNPLHALGALHFTEKSSSVIGYGIQTNSTKVLKRGMKQNPFSTFQFPLQLAAEREIARSLLGDPNFSWNVGYKAKGSIEKTENKGVDILPPGGMLIVYLAIPMFGFVFQIGSLVTEKELKLRQAMSMMGLYESAYWLSWLTWEGFLAGFTSLFIALFGKMFKFQFFIATNFTLLFLTFFLFEIAMIGLAFMISAFINKSSSATTYGFIIFVIGCITPVATERVYSFETKIYNELWYLFPPNLLDQGIRTMDTVFTRTDHGMRWGRRMECAEGGTECRMTMEGILLRFLPGFLLWFLLAIYLDNIIPNSNGVRKSVYYFLMPSYWTGNNSTKVEEGSLLKLIGAIPPLEEITPDDEDVLAEENAIRELASKDEIDPDIAVQIRGLSKTYPSSISIGGPSVIRMSSGFHAVKGIWVNLPKNQLFCLLGPNGAGKTTAISCLTGITPVTGGDALIYGHSIRNSVGMARIRKLIGVCPQFDLLWGSLTGREHLHLFSSLKGLPPSTIANEAERALAEVKLTKSAQVRSGSYSGGMRRRLSVAIALIGDPKLVFLDEPTTGMDPISRRHVWDIIEHAKKGRAIVLTTHSMEEADILSDRIAIMARGRFRCIGTSLRLKSRFGAGYIATVSLPAKPPGSTTEKNTTSDDDDDDDNDGGRPEAKPVKQFFRNYLELEPDEETEKFLSYIIPHEKKGILTEFFAELQDRKDELGISDIQLGLTPLEEVFLNIVKRAEKEESAPVPADSDQGM